MKLGLLKNLIGSILIGVHIVAIALCFYWLDSRLDNQDFRITILILTPVTAVYAMAYFKEVARGMFVGSLEVVDQRLVTIRFAVFSVLFSLLFCIAIIYTLYQFKTGTSFDADTLKDRLALVEVILGGFLGLIVETLFGRLPPDEGGGGSNDPAPQNPK